MRHVTKVDLSSGSASWWNPGFVIISVSCWVLSTSTLVITIIDVRVIWSRLLSQVSRMLTTSWTISITSLRVVRCRLRYHGLYDLNRVITGYLILIVITSISNADYELDDFDHVITSCTMSTTLSRAVRFKLRYYELSDSDCHHKYFECWLRAGRCRSRYYELYDVHYVITSGTI